VSEATMRQMAEITRRVAEGDISREALQVLINQGAKLGWPLLRDNVLHEARQWIPVLQGNEHGLSEALTAIAAVSGMESDRWEARIHTSAVHSPMYRTMLYTTLAKVLDEQQDADAALNAIAARWEGKFREESAPVLCRIVRDAVDGGYENIVVQLRPHVQFLDDYDEMVSVMIDCRNAREQSDFDELLKRAENIGTIHYRKEAFTRVQCSLAYYDLSRALELYRECEQYPLNGGEITTVIAGALAAEGRFEDAREVARKAGMLDYLVRSFSAIARKSHAQQDFDEALGYARQFSRRAHIGSSGARALAQVVGALNEVISTN